MTITEFQTLYKNKFQNETEIANYFLAPQQKEELQELKRLYLLYFKKHLTGCVNCLTDAFVELCYLKVPKDLNDLNHEEQALSLKRGVVLTDYKKSLHERKKLCTFATCSFEELKYYFDSYPEYRKFFITKEKEMSLIPKKKK